MNLTYKKFITPTVILFIVFNYLLSLIPISYLPEYLQSIYLLLINPIVLINIVFSVIFFFLWKIPLLNFIFKIPKLQGTWVGKIHYSYEHENREKTVFLTISQTNCFSVKCRFFTDERISISDFANIETSDVYQKLIYTYHSEENIKNKDKNPMHSGTVDLNISEENGKKHLDGFYYTDRSSNGTINLSLISKKKINSYAEGLKLTKTKNKQ